MGGFLWCGQTTSPTYSLPHKVLAECTVQIADIGGELYKHYITSPQAMFVLLCPETTELIEMLGNVIGHWQTTHNTSEAMQLLCVAQMDTRYPPIVGTQNQVPKMLSTSNFFSYTWLTMPGCSLTTSGPHTHSKSSAFPAWWNVTTITEKWKSTAAHQMLGLHNMTYIRTLC